MVEIAIQQETEHRRDAIKAKDGGSRDVKESPTNCGAGNLETMAVRHRERSEMLPADCCCFPEISKIPCCSSSQVFVVVAPTSISCVHAIVHRT